MRSTGRAAAALWGTVALMAVFEAASVLATQAGSLRHRSPWQDDPYNTAVSVALVVVPVLGILLAVRLVSRHGVRSAGSMDQMTRAALAASLLVDVVVCIEWAAVADGAHRAVWNADTAGLVALLAVITLAAAGLSVVHLRTAGLRRTAPWDSDWLEELAAISARLPGAGSRDLTGLIAWTRRRALVVFTAASMLGGLVVVAALAYGEHWTDPRLAAWAFTVMTAANLAACLIGNAVAGFVRRPPSRHPDLEVSVAAGCLAVQVAVAFHAQLWTALAGHAPDTVASMTWLTAGAALAGAGIAYPISSRLRRRRGAVAGG